MNYNRDKEEKESDVVTRLSPTQEHFLKKYVLESILSDELHVLNTPECCSLIGEPFDVKVSVDDNELPAIRFFFQNFIRTFPFIACNSDEKQKYFWSKAVQPFIKSFNTKNISNSDERQENVTKRKQFNKKLLSGMLLFYNSMIITDKDMTYLNESHLKSSDAGKLDKLEKGMKARPIIVSEYDDYNQHNFVNNSYINIVAVRQLDPAESVEPPKAAWEFWKGLPFTNSSTPHHHYEFVIQFTTRILKEKGYEYHNSFISRPYGDFKALDKELRRKLPGTMAEVTKLPHKFKELKEFENSRSQTESKNDATPPLKALKKERLRLALRGYMSEMLKHPELVDSEAFKRFVSEGGRNFKKLTDDDINDYKQRLEHEKHLLQTQKKFQVETAKVMREMSKSMDEFKTKVITQPGTIVDLFSEIGRVSDVRKMSPLLQTFNEWCKLEIAATIYQIFLTQDNSYETLSKWRKFNRLFPYNIIYGILKFTNPVSVVSKVVDLLLIDIPTISFPSWKANKADAGESEASNYKNLLSMIFVLLLDEDLDTYNKELSLLQKSMTDTGFRIFLERIDNYIAMSYDDAHDIKLESLDESNDILLTILNSKRLTPKLDSSDEELLKSVHQSFSNLTDNESSKSSVGADIYLNLKQYWQLKTRKRDKDLFKQLWREPELTLLIKQFLTLFYQPLMRLFGKCQIHLAFKAFQHFVDEMLHELTVISDQEFYFLDSFEVYNRIKSLIDKHQGTLWDFLHNVYKQDDQNLFLGLIEWIERFLLMIRLKFEDSNKVVIQLNPDGAIDEDLFVKQINSRIKKIVGRRQIFQSYLQKKSQLREGTNQGKIINEWEETNEKVFSNMDSHEFGVNSDDIQEFNILNIEDDVASKDGAPENELTLKLRQLDRAESFGTSELDKFILSTRSQLINIFDNLGNERATNNR